MTNARGGVLRRLLLLLLVAWGGWFVAGRWWPRNNPQTFSGRLESELNHELSRQGVTDADVRRQVRKERNILGLTWIETDRTIDIATLERVEAVKRALAKLATRMGCAVESKPVPGGSELRISRFGWLVQRLTLAAPQVKKSKQAKVAIVIDDVAYETAPMDRFAALGIPLTFAILPRDKHSRQLALKAEQLNFPVMLHLPMEPQDRQHNDPGPSGLYLDMTDEQLHTMFDKNVASVPHLVGINNHMGSAFTEDERRMELVMRWVKKRQLYFLDSHTTGKSVVCRAAKRVGVPCLTNEFFLDNADDAESIEKVLDAVMRQAERKGQTIAIGHYRRKHLIEALERKLPEFRRRGIEIVALPGFYSQ